MFQSVARRSIIKNGRSVVRQPISKRWSSDHHDADGPDETMFPTFLVIPTVGLAAVYGIYKLDQFYQDSHNGDSMFSSLAQPVSDADLDVETKKYQARVLSQRQLYELIGFTPKRDKNNFPLFIDGVPGQYFPFNAGSNYAVSVDFNNLEERKVHFDANK